MSGNNVSHSERKTKRTFKVNLKRKRFFSVALGGYTRKIRVSTRAIKSIDLKEGFDGFMLTLSPSTIQDTYIRKLYKNITNFYNTK